MAGSAWFLAACGEGGPDSRGQQSVLEADEGTHAGAIRWPSSRQFDPDERKALAAWRARRDVRMTAPDGYLSLVALGWLRPGEQRIGAHASAEIELPAGMAPEQLGVLRVEGDQEHLSVHFVAHPGVAVSDAGTPLGDAAIEMHYGDDTTVLAVGELTFWIIERAGQLAVRASSPRSPVRAAYRGNAVFPASGAWRLPALWRPHAEARPLSIPNVMGTHYADQTAGVLEFEFEGRRHQLWPTGDPQQSLSLIFGDATNGHSTYAGGRFLTVPPPDQDGLTWLDFNRAYNPPCNYSPYTTCPLPPPVNRLPFGVEAGERAYDKTTPRVLLLTQSRAYVHDVVARPADGGPSPVETALLAAGAPRFDLHTSQDASQLTAEVLAGYDAVVLYSTGELPLPEPEALVDFVANGGGLVGVHSAADSFYEVPEYQAMLGGVFDGHPWRGAVQLTVEAPHHLATRGLPSPWALSDEIYQFRGFDRSQVDVLLSLDTSSVELSSGKREDGDYALAWCRSHGQGRVFFTALGHEPELWQDPVFVEHVLGGLIWALGAG